MPSDDLEPRVADLEAQVRRLREQVRAGAENAAAARILAGAADRDVGELTGELRDFRRATTAGFNALREDLTDLRGYIDSRFDQVDSRFDQVDNGFTEMRGKFDAAAAGQQRIVELLEGLIAGQA